jgi:hypothetical protein
MDATPEKKKEDEQETENEKENDFVKRNCYYYVLQ